ncbi:TonB-dependent receptor [bacterium]|nr:TonB-dependent receptor [bacterium]
MDMTLEQILNMEVTTVSKSAELMSDAPGVISVLTKDEIERFGGTTLKDILERMPSLSVSTIYMTDRSTIAPRGDQVLPSSAHVLLLINGRPVREAQEGGIKSEMYESFPVNIIEKIEVIRGPGSVLYGSNAFSAVINVITEPVEETVFSVKGMAGQSGAYGAMAKAKVKLGDLSIAAAGRLFKKAEWETDWQYAVPDSAAGDTIVTHTIPNEGPGAFLEMKYKNLRFMSSYAQWETAYFIADYASRFPSYGLATWDKLFLDLGYSLKVSDIWNMDFSVTDMRSTFETPSSWPYTARDSYEMVAEWTNFITPTDKLNIIFGGLYNYLDGEENVQGMGNVNHAHRWSFGVYSQLDYKLLKSLKVIGGVQANKVEKIDLDIVPRGGIIWHPVDCLDVKALYSQAFRAPSINELGLKHVAMMGNPNLVPEKVNTMDIGINYQGDQIRLGINFFDSKMTDLIIQDRSGKFPVPTYDNIGEVSIQGIEFEGKYYLSNRWFLTGSMLYQTSEDKGGNENVTPIANLGAKAGISYRSELLTVSLFNSYQGNLDEKYETQLNPSPGAYNMMNLYCRLNMKRLLNMNMSQSFALFLQVDNLLDKELWLPDWGLTPGKSMPVNPGRALYIGLDASL